MSPHSGAVSAAKLKGNSISRTLFYKGCSSKREVDLKRNRKKVQNVQNFSSACLTLLFSINISTKYQIFFDFFFSSSFF